MRLVDNNKISVEISYTEWLTKGESYQLCLALSSLPVYRQPGLIGFYVLLISFFFHIKTFWSNWVHIT